MLSVFDAILGLIWAEGAVLSLLYIWTGRGIAPREAIPNLAAGFFLLLTVRLSLSGAPAWALCASLLGALIAHAVDLGQRWRRGTKTEA